MRRRRLRGFRRRCELSLDEIRNDGQHEHNTAKAEMEPRTRGNEQAVAPTKENAGHQKAARGTRGCMKIGTIGASRE